ncbi:MAG: restriction endonuclease subunit S, partial [Lactiplantibacillus plantarum]
MSLTGNVGRVGLLSAEMLPAALNQRVACIRIRNPAVIYKPFLFHLLNSDYFENKCILASQGVAQKNMSTEWLKEYPIPSFSMDKQMEIASIFDKIDDLIARRKEQVRNMDQAVKSRFIELFGDIVLNPFGWEKDYLGVVCDVRDGTHDSPHYHSTGFPLVTSKNVTGGEIDLTDCSLISEADFNKINERSKVNMGDIIMPMIGTVGKPVIVNVEPNFAIKNVSLIKFKDDSRVLNTFVRSLLQSDYFDDAVLSKVRGGTQKFISLGDIRKLAVIVPPMELQEQFAAFVEQTDKSKLCGTMEVAA